LSVINGKYIRKPNTSYQHTGVIMEPNYKPLKFRLLFTMFQENNLPLTREDLIQKMRDCERILKMGYAKNITINLTICDNEKIELD
jgi:hypothetical protein